MEYKKKDKFIEKLSKRLENYYNDKWGIKANVQDRYESGRFSYNGIPLTNALRIWFSVDNKTSINKDDSFDIPLDELRIRYSNSNDDFMYMVVYFYTTGYIWETYSYNEKNKSRILDLVAKYLKVSDGYVNNIESYDVGFSGNYEDRYRYEVNTPQGKTSTYICGQRSKGQDGYLGIGIRVNYGLLKWNKFLRGNPVKVTTDESTWDDAIDKIIDVIDTINSLVSEVIKQGTIKTLNLFLDDLKTQVQAN